MNQLFVKHLASKHMVSVSADLAAMSKEFDAAGVKISATSLKQLIEKKRDTVAGCALAEMTEAGAAESEGEPSRALKPHTVGGEGEIQTTQLTPEPTAAAKTPRARASIQAYQPTGKVKPVRKGTKIANGMEALLAGASLKELEELSQADKIGDDVVDFCNRRIKKRGYGIKVDGDKFFLVAPGGAIQYTASAADEKEDKKAEDTKAPAPEVGSGEGSNGPDAVV